MIMRNSLCPRFDTEKHFINEPPMNILVCNFEDSNERINTKYEIEKFNFKKLQLISETTHFMKHICVYTVPWNQSKFSSKSYNSRGQRNHVVPVAETIPDVFVLLRALSVRRS